MPVTQYIGARYMPIFADPPEHSTAKTYEPLTIVLHEGNSYTSKQFVPKGISIDNEAYWAETGNYNAQVEAYRQETARVAVQVQQTQNDIDTLLPKSAFSANSTVLDMFNASYVIPEQFGAIGDNVNDDSQAFVDMFAALENKKNSVIWLDNTKTYKLDSTVYINVPFVTIMGNGATINGGEKTAFIITETNHDIVICGVNFIETYVVDSQMDSNAGIGIQGRSTTALYQAYNIEIANCSFDGGVFGIAATNVSNLHIHNCQFGSFVYKPEDRAGGYAILEQSCNNVSIHECLFTTGQYGRHAIYVSVSQPKTANKASRNIDIYNCIFDNRNMTLIDGAFYSPTTTSINVRMCINTHIHNCILYRGTALAAFFDEDGVIYAKIEQCQTYNARYLASDVAPAEARSCINVICTNPMSHVSILDCTNTSPDANMLDASLRGNYIEFGNTTVTFRVLINDVNYLYMHDVIIPNAGAIRYDSENNLNGKFAGIRSNSNNVSFPNCVGSGKCSISMFELDAREGFYLVADGSLRTPNHTHIAVTAEKTGNDIILTFPSLYERPMPILFENINASALKFAVVNYFDSTLDPNQVRLRFYNTQGTQVSEQLNMAFTV